MCMFVGAQIASLLIGNECNLVGVSVTVNVEVIRFYWHLSLDHVFYSEKKIAVT